MRIPSTNRSARHFASLPPVYPGRGGKAGFSLIELMTVIAIIGILALIVTPVVNKARESARQVDCKSNLRQLGVGITTYRAEHHGRNPGWLSNLFPRYIDDKHVYVCKTDEARGLGRTRPSGMEPNDTGGPFSTLQQDYSETIDNDSNPTRESLGANTAIEACSYFYEFSAAPCSFGWDTVNWGAAPEGQYSWAVWKSAQLEYGDGNSGKDTKGKPLPYSRSRMPIVRCYHHFDRSKVPGYLTGGRFSEKEHMTINVGYAGNVFVAPLWWEGTPEPGDENLR